MDKFKKQVIRWLLLALPLSAQAQQWEPLQCGTFDLQTKWLGSEVEVSLKTDLPVNTTVMFGISRVYTKVGSSEKYSGGYHSRKTIVGSLRTPKRYTVDDVKWDRQRKEQQIRMARLGEPFTIQSISNAVEVSVVVPINQSDPRFGKGNKNLVGCGVSIPGLRIIRREVVLTAPYNGVMSGVSVASLDPRNLEVGRGYIVEKRTPLMHEHSPANPIAGLRNTRFVSPGNVLRILDRQMVAGNMWYWVAASSSTSERMGNGWVNSTALLGQKLEPLLH